MEFIKIAYTSILSVVVLLVLSKIMGNRQMSQLSMFDYICSITIGSIAAEMATALETDYRYPLLAMVIYAVFAVVVSYVTSKSIAARRILTGKATVLFEDGKIYEQNLKKSKLDISEFLSECRIAGYFDLSNIQTAILEANGKISFIPIATQRPATPQDMNISPKQERIVANVIIDGSILDANLKNMGKDTQWLKKELARQKAPSIAEIFLATCDADHKLTVYTKPVGSLPRDVFE